MLTTKDEIERILKRDIYGTAQRGGRVYMYGIDNAAEAIAKLTTKAHAAALFTGPRPGHANAFLMPVESGGTMIIITNPTEEELQYAVQAQDSDNYMVDAIRIYLARQEAI